MNDQQKNNANNSEYIRLADAARFVPYSKDYISLLARQGRIDAKKIGRDWHTTQLAVEEYYRSQEARRSLLNTGRPLGELRQDFVEAGRPMLAVSEEAGDGRPVFEPRWQDLRSSDQIQVTPRSIPTSQPQPVTPIVRASEPAVSVPVATTNSTRSSIGSFGIITRIVVPLAAILVIFGGVRFTPADVVVYGVKDFVALAGEMRKEFVRVVEGGLVAVDEAGNMRVLGNIEAGGQLVSTIMDGIAPLSVRSTTTVPNLSAQYLDGVTKEDIDLAFVVGNGASTAARVALRGGADIASLVVDGTASIATLAVESLTSKEAMIEDARVERADIGQASIAGLSVSGGSTLSDTEIDGTLDVSGTATLRRASVQGRLSVDGTLSVTDSVSAPLFSGGGGNFGNVDIENKLSFTDSATVNLYKKLNVSENVLVTDASFQVGGTLSIAGAFTPATDNTQSIGSSSLRWKDAFLGPEGIKIYNTTGDDAEYATLGYSANVITLTSAADGAGTARNFNITGGNVGIGTTSPDNAVTIDDGSLSFSTAGGASDVVLSRGTSNRLDLADGDSFRIVGGTLQLDLDDTGATQGVVFGSTSDVNLYRSAANTLRTDDSLSVGVQLALPTQGSTGGFVIGTDTNLYRSAADTLYTDDSLVVSAQLQLPASGSSSAGILLGGDVNIYRTASNRLNLGDDDILTFPSRSATSDVFVESAVSGDAFYRFQITANGTLQWGDGTATRDTNLYRSAANTLRTDDSLYVGGSLTVDGLTAANGSLDLGDTAADTITFVGVVDSDIIPSTSTTYDLGSSSRRWAEGFFDSVTANTLTGVVAGGSTTSSTWTINSDNASANAEVSGVAFETGTGNFNATLQWNASGDAGRISGFDDTLLSNYPIAIFSEVSGPNQSFTSGTLFSYGQNATHAITQSGAFTGIDVDFSSNITVPNSANGNQTGIALTLADGGASATATGLSLSGTADYGINLSGATIGTAAIVLPTGTAAAQGIDFGGDVSLYRSAANVLFTPDQIESSYASSSALKASTATAGSIGIELTNSYSTLNIANRSDLSGGLAVRLNSSSDLLTLSTGGQLAVPTTGSSAGILLGGDAQLYRGAADRIDLASNDGMYIRGGSGGGLGVGASPSTSKSLYIDRIEGNSTRSAEFMGIDSSVSAIQFTGNVTNQRLNYFGGLSVSGDSGTRTITNYATVYIADAATVGANAAVTNNYALWVDAGTTRLDGSLQVNAASGDFDSYINSDTSTLAYFDSGVNAGVGSVTFGYTASNPDASNRAFVEIYPPAFSGAASTNTFAFKASGGAGITIPAGTTSIAATAGFFEPTLTATGTITNAATLYVASAPTEGSSGNYALFVDSGTTRLDGALQGNSSGYISSTFAVGSTASDASARTTFYDNGWSASSIALFQIDDANTYNFTMYNNTASRTWAQQINDSGSFRIIDTTGGAARLTIDTGGQLAIPTTGSSAGLLIGGDTQLYRSAANALSLASGDSLIVESGEIRIRGNGTQRLWFDKTDNGVDEKKWDFTTGVSTFLGRTLNDAEDSAATWLTVTRSGTTVSGIDLSATTVTVPGSGGLTIGSDTNLSRSAANTLALATGDTLDIINGNITLSTNGTKLGKDTTTNYLSFGASESGNLDLNASGQRIAINIDTDNDSTTSAFQIFKDGVNQAGTLLFHFDESGYFSVNTNGSSGGIWPGTDVQLYRGSTNRLDLASGDSLYITDGTLGIGTVTSLLTRYSIISNRDFSSTTASGSIAQMGIRGTTTATGGTFPVGTLEVTPSGTVINSGGTHSLASSLYISEPVITLTSGSVTNAASLYVANAPTEGSSGNYALFIDSGSSRFDGSVGVGTTATDAVLDVVSASGTTFNAHFQNTTAATPYGVWVEEPAAATAAYPLLTVTNDGGGTSYFRVDSGGKSAFGASPNQGYGVYVSNDFSYGSGEIHGLKVGEMTLTQTSAAGSSVQSASFGINSSIVINSGATHNLVSNAYFSMPSITETSGSVTNAANIYVEGAPTAATNNYALWVDAGNARLDGSLSVGDSGPSSTYLINADNFRSSTSGTFATVHSLTYINPASASSAAYYGAWMRMTPAYAGQSLTNAVIAFGAQLNDLETSGTLSNYYGFRSTFNIASGRTVSNLAHFNAVNSTPSGTLTTQYGLLIEDMTGATNDYGIAIAGADTQALWIGHGADNTDAANGIAFGSSRDTNLYRLASNTLATDDSFQARGGTFNLGVADTTGATINLHGAASGDTGAFVRFYMSADHDTTDEHWTNWIYQDDMYWSLATTGSMMRLDNTGRLNVLTNGSSGGINIGSDTVLYRGDTNRLDLGSGDSLRIVSGEVQFGSGGTYLVDSSARATFQNVTSLATVYLGVEDTSRATLALYGQGTGQTDGARASFYFSADYDGTTDRIDVGTVEDDLRLELSNGTDLALFKNEGQLQLPVTGSSAGILIGGDFQIYRLSADFGYTPDTLQVGGAFQVDGIAYFPSTGLGGGLRIGGDTNLYRSAADVLATSDSFQVGGDILASLAPTSTPVTQTLTTVDSTGSVGQYTSIAIGTDGYPVISYYEYNTGTLKIAKCGNSACSSGNTVTTVDPATSVGNFGSIAIGTDGYPVISYYDFGNEDLKVAKCNNATCTTSTITTVDSTGSVGNHTSIAIGTDGMPVISYYTTTSHDLKVAKCTATDCSTSTITTVDSTGTVGQYTSIAIGADGMPVIAYYDVTNTDLKVAKCSTSSCSSSVLTTASTSPALYISMAIGSDGLPVISAYNTTTARVVKCSTATCSSVVETTIENVTSTGAYPSIAIGTDGFPIIAYYDDNSDDLDVAKCLNVDCSSFSLIPSIDSTGSVGQHTSIAIGTDGLPVISYWDSTNGDLKVAKCGTPSCSGDGHAPTGGSNIGSLSNYFNNVYANQYWGKSFSIANFDLAEEYFSQDELTPGTIVSVYSGEGGRTDQVQQSSTPYEETLMGIVSTQPGITLADWQQQDRTGMYPIALAGRVPVKVSNENGPIKPGDAITSSDIPGVGMKATSAGRIIGIALGSYESEDLSEVGSVIVFVNTSWWSPTAGGLALEQGGQQEGTTPTVTTAISGLTTATIDGIQSFFFDGIVVARNAFAALFNVSNERIGSFATSFISSLVSGGDELIAESSKLKQEASADETGPVQITTYSLQSSSREIMISGTGMMRECAGYAAGSMTGCNAIAGMLGFSTSFGGDDVAGIVAFAPEFSALLDESVEVRVLITPTDEVSGTLYVAEKSIRGFVVAESVAQDVGITFDWIVVARIGDGTGAAQVEELFAQEEVIDPISNEGVDENGIPDEFYEEYPDGMVGSDEELQGGEEPIIEENSGGVPSEGEAAGGGEESAPDESSGATPLESSSEDQTGQAESGNTTTP